MSEVISDKKTILIVDDEKNIRESLNLLLKDSYIVEMAENGQQALKILDEQKPAVILLDLTMPEMDGLSTLKEFRERNIKSPVLVLTGNGTIKTAVEAVKLGALDYIAKPFDIAELNVAISAAIAEYHPLVAAANSRSCREKYKNIEADFGPMIGQSAAMQAVFQKVNQIAVRDTTALITGESGTGKELIAHQIHNLSSRRDKPFVAINCAAIPETLIESELFGHEKGSFTSAVDRRIGHFEVADGGTIFLDEIGELNLSVQVKMLRFLQEQEFYRVGRSKPIKVDVRIIAATNKHLEQLIREKKFRQDLYYRINVINVELPALRDRFEDIPALATFFIEKYSESYGGRKISFSKDATQGLVQYAWPGNVRELENVIECLMALAPNDEIAYLDLPPRIRAPGSGSISVDSAIDVVNFQEAEKNFESEMIIKALRKTNYVQTRAAELLGISRRILKYKMDKLGIADEAIEEEKAN